MVSKAMICTSKSSPYKHALPPPPPLGCFLRACWILLQLASQQVILAPQDNFHLFDLKHFYQRYIELLLLTQKGYTVGI